MGGFTDSRVNAGAILYVVWIQWERQDGEIFSVCDPLDRRNRLSYPAQPTPPSASLLHNLILWGTGPPGGPRGPVRSRGAGDDHWPSCERLTRFLRKMVKRWLSSTSAEGIRSENAMVSSGSAGSPSADSPSARRMDFALFTRWAPSACEPISTGYSAAEGTATPAFSRASRRAPAPPVQLARTWTAPVYRCLFPYPQRQSALQTNRRPSSPESRREP